MNGERLLIIIATVVVGMLAVTAFLSGFLLGWR